MAISRDVEDRGWQPNRALSGLAVGRAAARHTLLLVAPALSLSHVVAVRGEEP